jgi:hypothetical protein
MSYIPDTCPHCGNNLDPGEICECQKSDAVVYPCKYCGQTSFIPGCSCEGAEAEKRRMEAECGRREAYRDMAELLFPRFIEREDDGYESDPNYKLFVATIDQAIDGRISRATFDLDLENKITITAKDWKVQMQLTRTIKTAKTASVA